MTSIDIYPNSGFGDQCLSPVDGEIVEIRRVRAPQGIMFKDRGCDFVIIIKSINNPNQIVKILHIETELKVGKIIRVGEKLGFLLRSGYFGYHTAPHIHLEVRPAEDPLRVRGGIPINCLMDFYEQKPVEMLRGIVVKSLPEFAVLELEGLEGFGVLAEVEGKTAILDGGIPTYGWVGAHMVEAPRAGVIKLLGKPIAHITESRGNACIANCFNFDIKLSKTKVGLYMSLQFGGLVHVSISSIKSNLHLKKGEEVKLTIE